MSPLIALHVVSVGRDSLDAVGSEADIAGVSRGYCRAERNDAEEVLLVIGPLIAAFEKSGNLHNLKRPVGFGRKHLNATTVQGVQFLPLQPGRPFEIAYRIGSDP